MDKLNFRTETIGDLLIETYHVIDDNETPDNDPSLYDEVDVYERAKYEAEDLERATGFDRGLWHYIGICVDIRLKTRTNWAVPHMVGHASLWRVESDAGDDYIRQCEREVRADALCDMGRTRDALAKVATLKGAF